LERSETLFLPCDMAMFRRPLLRSAPYTAALVHKIRQETDSFRDVTSREVAARHRALMSGAQALMRLSAASFQKAGRVMNAIRSWPRPIRQASTSRSSQSPCRSTIRQRHGSTIRHMIRRNAKAATRHRSQRARPTFSCQELNPVRPAMQVPHQNMIRSRRLAPCATGITLKIP
jgi:hypothetical protein